MSIGKSSLARAAVAATAPVAEPAAQKPRLTGVLQSVAVTQPQPVRGRSLPASVPPELTQSVRKDGVIEPLLLARSSAGDLWILAGEKRLCAARAASLEEVPAVIVEMTAAQAVKARAELEKFVARPQALSRVAVTRVGDALPYWLL